MSQYVANPDNASAINKIRRLQRIAGVGVMFVWVVIIIGTADYVTNLRPAIDYALNFAALGAVIGTVVAGAYYYLYRHSMVNPLLKSGEAIKVSAELREWYNSLTMKTDTYPKDAELFDLHQMVAAARNEFEADFRANNNRPESEDRLGFWNKKNRIKAKKA